jgi:hypothetical protein
VSCLDDCGVFDVWDVIEWNRQARKKKPKPQPPSSREPGASP